MKAKLIAASILALGLAGGAMAQSNPSPSGSTIGGSTVDSGGGANPDAPNTPGTSPTVVDPTATYSTTPGTMNAGPNTNTTGTVDRTRCPPQPMPGSTAAQGGNSGASQSEACPDIQ
ncbi:hypothetical protein [Rhizobium sp. AN80A]|uniref:hypothetical protein n=1 Tax=Rhizobium sp. AN80A TaxID=3040673 RepID=UPI0024B3A314|nr:hypothetical protein [Rhizobium sp. AN80A]